MRTFSQAVVAVVSLDASMAEAGGTVADVVADPTINVEAEALPRVEHFDLWRQVEQTNLTEQQQAVIRMHYRSDVSMPSIAVRLSVRRWFSGADKAR